MEIELEHSGGIAMSNGTDAMPSDADIDTLMQGGTPNQERIGFDAPESEEQAGAEIHTDPNAPEAKGDLPQVKDGKALDPIVQQLQGALSKLTPEQRAQLIPAQAAEIVHNGEKIQIPPDKQVPLMQMGLNYSEKMRALNTERQEFEKAKAQTTEAERYYGEIDKVAKANPEWWQHVQAEYQKFSGKAGNATSAPGSAEMTPAERELRSEIQTLKDQLNGYLEKSSKEATQKQEQSEDAELNNQISSFQKEHPEFDWMTADEKSGLVLQDRIIVHAHQNGINNFRAAARDYLFNDLISRRELKTKEDLAKQIQSKTKAGVVVAKGKPTGLKPPKDLGKKDYADLMREGLAELG